MLSNLPNFTKGGEEVKAYSKRFEFFEILAQFHKIRIPEEWSNIEWRGGRGGGW